MDRSTGGVGGLTPCNPSDARLIEQAARNGWPMTEGIKRLAVNRIVGIIDKSKSERSVIAGVRALAEMNKQNISIDQPASTQVNVQVNNEITRDQLDNLSTDEVRRLRDLHRKLNGLDVVPTGS